MDTMRKQRIKEIVKLEEGMANGKHLKEYQLKKVAGRTVAEQQLCEN